MELLDGLVSMRVRPALIEAVIGGRVLVKVSAKDMNKSDLHGQDDEEEDNQVGADTFKGKVLRSRNG